MGLVVDWTLRISDVVMLIVTALILPALLAFSKALFNMRDNVVDLVRNMGKDDPPAGVLGDIAHLKREARRHRDWLIEANIIHPSDRS